MRASGVLLHITSLPSPYGIGTFGKEAMEFVDFLSKTKQTYWQILPVGHTTIGDSPYQAFSAFAGNPLLIDFDELIVKGYLNVEEVEKAYSLIDMKEVNYEQQFKNKYPLLRKAFEQFKKGDLTEYLKFVDKNDRWLKDYSLYMALKYENNQLPWNQWMGDIKYRKQDAILRYESQLQEEIQFWNFVQYIFDQQWRKLKAYANQNEIQIIGDIPIYVSYDSADVWAHPELFELDECLQPTMVAGCPPDDTFSRTGQLWGNPIYNWDKMKETKYEWWIDRFQYSLELYDILRIDHFRGFDSFYAIPFGNPTAEFGSWLEGPKAHFFEKIKEALGDLPIIAEDLGFITNSVRELLEYTGFPGMKVMEFGFSQADEGSDMPHNFVKNCIAYLGTHDNDTCRGYVESLDEETKKFLMKYIHVEKEEDCVEGMLRSIYSSVADVVIIQMQDFLDLGSTSRMNYPSKAYGNWTWRLDKSYCTKELETKVLDITTTYFRKK